MFCSTRNENEKFPLKHAVLRSYAEDKGLFFPSSIPLFPVQEFHKDDGELDLYRRIAYTVCTLFFGEWLKDEKRKKRVKELIHSTFNSANFGAEEIVKMRKMEGAEEEDKDDDFDAKNALFVLELFHGCTGLLLCYCYCYYYCC